MKGNLLTAIQGVEAVAAANGGTPPINLAFIFEGEEEIGSPSLVGIIREHSDLLAADAVASADGSQYDETTPALTVALKGLAGLQVNLRTANSDLHSGSYGASVPNAVQSMVQLAATFHDAEGHVLVEGFYDRVKNLTDADKAEIAASPFDEADFKARHHLNPHGRLKPGTLGEHLRVEQAKLTNGIREMQREARLLDDPAYLKQWVKAQRRMARQQGDDD